MPEPMGPQYTLDTRAIELAARAHLLAEEAEKRMTRHELECQEERREAREERRAFRAEVNSGMGELHAMLSSLPWRLVTWLIAVAGALVVALVALFWKLQGW